MRSALQVWDLSACRPVLELHQKSVTRDSWPAVQWRPDDSSAYHCVTNNVHVYERANGFAQYRCGALTIPFVGIVLRSFNFSPSLCNHLAG